MTNKTTSKLKTHFLHYLKGIPCKKSKGVFSMDIKDVSCKVCLSEVQYNQDYQEPPPDGYEYGVLELP